MRFYLAVALAAGALTAPHTATADADPLWLGVTPEVCFTPCAVRAKAIVEPHGDNRWLTLVADAPHFRRSSTVQLDGENAARTHTIWFKNLSGGTYQIEVRLKRSGGRTFLRQHVIAVKGER